MSFSLQHAYLLAKASISDQGYYYEIEDQQRVDFDEISDTTFLKEIAWVILSSGMSEKVIRSKFPKISEAFFGWSSVEKISLNSNFCFSNAMLAFANKRKINGIIQSAKILHNQGFQNIKTNIKNEGISYLKVFPFIGEITSYHLAKNIGLNIPKPDRHLVRIAKATIFDDVFKLCSYISVETGDPVSVVDIVLWRFATLEKDYVSYFKNTSPN